MGNWLDKVISYVSPQRGLRRAAQRRALELAGQFRGAEHTRLRADWILGTQPATPYSWELDNLRNRSRDLNCNDPVASGATETMATNIVGRGLRMQSRMRADALGVSEEQAKKWQRQAELVWQAWSPMADAGNRLDWDELQFLALRKIVEDGEILALPVMAGESWRPLKRCVELLESDRLSAPGTGKVGFNSQGVELGSRGEPKAYWLTTYDPVSGQSGQPQRVAARDSQGRPRVLHVFRTSRPGQCRGIPFFAPVLNYFKDLADYLEAEVVAARVAACLSVFVTKTDAYAAMGAMSTSTETVSGDRLQVLEPGLVSYLQPGENISVVEQKRGGETFNSFVEGVLRIIGISLGLPYELLVKDFSKTNYSSARAALLEGRRMFSNWRAWFAARFCQPIYDLVLEEAWLRGLFPVKDFYGMRAEYTRAQWLGGGWGWVDPVKEVESSRLAIDYGLSTLAEEAANQGRDWEETLEQLKREKDQINELGLDLARSVPGQAGGNNDAEAEKNESKQDYLKRCTAQVMGEGKEADQAFAQCNSMWEQSQGRGQSLSLAAPLELAGQEEGKATPRQFLLTAYTGEQIERWWGGRLVIDVAGIMVKAKMPILREHARDRVVGKSTKAWADDKNFYLQGEFSQVTRDSKEVLALADEGFPCQASVGVWPLQVLKVGEKEDVEVNGRRYAGPLDVWKKSRVGEVSFVALGADDNTAAIALKDENITGPVEYLPAEHKEGRIMEFSLSLLEQEAPDLLREIRETARAEGLTAGQELERARVVEILEADGDREISQKAIADGTLPADTFKLLYQAERSKRQGALASLEAEAPAPMGQQPPPAPEKAVNPDEKLAPLARDLARDKGLNLEAAMLEVAREHPELVGKWNPAAGLH